MSDESAGWNPNINPPRSLLQPVHGYGKTETRQRGEYVNHGVNMAGRVDFID